jgi:hypothetical protein
MAKLALKCVMHNKNKPLIHVLVNRAPGCHKCNFYPEMDECHETCTLCNNFFTS